ncbi:MAG: ribosome recycling factor [Buchnera aphidicola (Schlechtendalia peitan)]
MLNKVKIFTQKKMDDCIKTFVSYLGTLRTIGVSPSILDSIYIDYFGQKVQLCKLANIVVENFNTLTINLFDMSIKNNVEKTIINSELGLTPISIGNTLKIILPSLTEERRKNYIKLAKNAAEKNKICIRNVRRHANERIKRYLKDKLISMDIERNLQNEIQHITDEYIKKINTILEEKEKKLMNV